MRRSIQNLTSAILVLLTAASLSACSTRVMVRDKAVLEFNNSLKADANGIRSIQTYVLRPGFFWDICLEDGADDEAVFKKIVAFVNQSDVYMRLKDKYSGTHFYEGVEIVIRDRDGQRLYSYKSSVYKLSEPPGADLKDVADNLLSWRMDDWKDSSFRYFEYDEPTGTVIETTGDDISPT